MKLDIKSVIIGILISQVIISYKHTKEVKELKQEIIYLNIDKEKCNE